MMTRTTTLTAEIMLEVQDGMHVNYFRVLTTRGDALSGKIGVEIVNISPDKDPSPPSHPPRH